MLLIMIMLLFFQKYNDIFCFPYGKPHCGVLFIWYGIIGGFKCINESLFELKLLVRSIIYFLLNFNDLFDLFFS